MSVSADRITGLSGIRTFYAKPEIPFWPLDPALHLVNKRGAFEIELPAKRDRNFFLKRTTVVAVTFDPTTRRILGIQQMLGIDQPGSVLMEKSIEDPGTPIIKVRGYWRNPYKSRS